VEKNLDGRSQYISIPIHSLLLVASDVIMVHGYIYIYVCIRYRYVCMHASYVSSTAAHVGSNALAGGWSVQLQFLVQRMQLGILFTLAFRNACTRKLFVIVSGRFTFCS